MDAIKRPNPAVRLPCPAKDAVVDTLRDLLPQLALMGGVVGVFLFGSVARGEDTPESDVDVAVQMPPDVAAKYRVRDFMELHLNRRVDLTRLPLPPLLENTAGRDLIEVR